MGRKTLQGAPPQSLQNTSSFCSSNVQNSLNPMASAADLHNFEHSPGLAGSRQPVKSRNQEVQKQKRGIKVYKASQDQREDSFDNNQKNKDVNVNSSLELKTCKSVKVAQPVGVSAASCLGYDQLKYVKNQQKFYQLLRNSSLNKNASLSPTRALKKTSSQTNVLGVLTKSNPQNHSSFLEKGDSIGDALSRKEASALAQGYQTHRFQSKNTTIGTSGAKGTKN